MNCLFDTNILIHALNGVHPAAAAIIEQAPARWRAISRVTWIEVMIGTTPENVADTRRFLSAFRMVELTEDVAEKAIMVRKALRLKLPDALIYASAIVTGRTLVTGNTRDFKEEMASVLLIPPGGN
jgi:hypothetical protein